MKGFLQICLKEQKLYTKFNYKTLNFHFLYFQKFLRLAYLFLTEALNVGLLLLVLFSQRGISALEDLNSTAAYKD